MQDFSFLDEEADSTSSYSKTQDTLADTEMKLGAVLNTMPVGLIFHTEQGIIYANNEACSLLRTSKKNLIGQHFLDFVRSTEFDRAINVFNAVFKKNTKILRTESVIVSSDGTKRLIKITSGRLPWEGTPVIQIMFEDITAQKKAEQSLRRLSITDELTGAFNRRHAFYEAGLYVEKGVKSPFGVILMDIDHFKTFNDTYGHATGDYALKEVARVAQNFTTTISGCNSALFARIGGEEFLLLLPGLTIDAIAQEAERLRIEISKIKIASEDGDLISVAISSGAAQYKESDGDFDRLLQRADKALYVAKQEGRNCVRIAK